MKVKRTKEDIYTLEHEGCKHLGTAITRVYFIDGVFDHCELEPFHHSIDREIETYFRELGVEGWKRLQETSEFIQQKKEPSNG